MASVRGNAKDQQERWLGHALEDELGAPASTILEAISRSSDLTKRGIRGLLAEAAFAEHILPRLDEWNDVTPSGNHPFDFVLARAAQRVSIQVKLQRQKNHRPMTADQGYKKLLSPEYWVTETQKTRGGKGLDGKSTRPYRFGEFDLLAVSLHPATGDWGDFRFTLGRWLLPHPDDPDLILKFQPVPKKPDGLWTDSLEESISWLQSPQPRQIRGILEIS